MKGGEKERREREVVGEREERRDEVDILNIYLVSVLFYFILFVFVYLFYFSGAMLVGMALPRSNGGQISRQALSERLEDLSSLFFLPLFFTVSGIHTNFQKLDLWDWGICIMLFAIAFVTKVFR